MAQDDMLDNLSDLDDIFGPEETAKPAEGQTSITNTAPVDDDEGIEEELPGQLAVDVYETPEKLVVKARTAGVNKGDLDVSISEGILTITGTLSSGEEINVSEWHMQECYWGEFKRTLALPAKVEEDSAEAVLKDGVLTVSFDKIPDRTTKKVLVK